MRRGRATGEWKVGRGCLRYENPHIIVIVIVMDQPQCCNFVIGNRHVVSMCVCMCVLWVHNLRCRFAR